MDSLGEGGHYARNDGPESCAGSRVVCKGADTKADPTARIGLPGLSAEAACGDRVRRLGCGGEGRSDQRITEKLDPRGYVVYPISAPQGEDKTRHYLYRFWRRLPERGQIAIFDRSWYGRVLVEEWKALLKRRSGSAVSRRSTPSNRPLRDYGVILAKYWIHISREEQLRRFEERKAIGYKEWKLTEEDWRIARRRGAYEEAVEEMLVKTSTRTSPWCLVEGNDKYWARVKVLARLVEILSVELGCTPTDR